VVAPTDATLMRLNQPPPAGVRFSGSLLAAQPVGTSASGLHHPAGDLLKFSQGNIDSYASCAGVSCTLQSRPANANFLTVRWGRGTTETGSSGSALFTPVGSNQYVMGHLFAGLASCTRPTESDYYGRFDVDYRAALYRWLGDVSGAR
jgi:lysyl endopeptidase